MIIFFFQARYESSRLPGKMLKAFDINTNPLGLIASRFKHFAKIYKFPLENAHFLFPDTPKLSSLVSAINYVSPRFFTSCGHPDNVLQRFQDHLAILNRLPLPITHIVRVCCDNPFIDFEAIFSDLETHVISSKYFYFQRTINGLPSTFSSAGLAYEIISVDHLLSLRTSMPRAEHVTLDLYEHYDQTFWNTQPSFEDLYGIISDKIRLTLDYGRDFEFINHLLSIPDICWNISTGDLINYLNNSSDLLDSMAYNISLSASKP
tara:strand:+ start:16205 stop:16993 length:789 start_codon:yes stop_codon:yes gene_type:complete